MNIIVSNVYIIVLALFRPLREFDNGHFTNGNLRTAFVLIIFCWLVVVVYLWGKGKASALICVVRLMKETKDSIPIKYEGVRVMRNL